MVKPTKVTNSIRSLRFEHGEMTQADLANRVGVTRQTIMAIERGRYSPSLEMAFQITHVFNVPLDHVFQYPVPSSNPGDDPMQSSSDRKQTWPATGRLVDEIRKLRGRPDTERLVDGIDKLRERPDTEHLVEEIRKLGGRPDTERLVEEVRKLGDRKRDD
jgi:putative transcriptional regulator